MEKIILIVSFKNNFCKFNMYYNGLSLLFEIFFLDYNLQKNLYEYF